MATGSGQKQRNRVRTVCFNVGRGESGALSIVGAIGWVQQPWPGSPHAGDRCLLTCTCPYACKRSSRAWLRTNENGIRFQWAWLEACSSACACCIARETNGAGQAVNQSASLLGLARWIRQPNKVLLHLPNLAGVGLYGLDGTGCVGKKTNHAL